MHSISWITTAAFLLDLLIRIGLSLRVINRRLPVGTTLAWLAVILIFPYFGAVLYLLFGEYRLGRRRTERMAELAKVGHDWLPPAQAGVEISVDARGLGVARATQAALNCPLLVGNQLELLKNADAAFPALVEDIDRATRTCDLEFYIWSVGGRADEVVAALIRADKRGVACRVLVDAIGSAGFLRSPLVKALRQNGIRVQAALPAGPIQVLFVRADLRLHRKIAVIDGKIGYTGSLNLADPRFFKQSAGVGQWVDALVRVQGPAVQALAVVFLQDWSLETGDSIDWQREMNVAEGNRHLGDPEPVSFSTVQVLPTGPDAHVEAIEGIVLTALYAATEELVLTTPYFIPDESMLLALKSAAGRGVRVTLIVPARVDSRVAHYASRAHQIDLLAAGVQIALFEGGLLHTKSITVDGRFSLFGSLNLDPRSLRLDFEITLAVYNAEFTQRLRQLQQTYLDRSIILDMDVCRSRSSLERLKEDVARLVGPLL